MPNWLANPTYFTFFAFCENFCGIPPTFMSLIYLYTIVFDVSRWSYMREVRRSPQLLSVNQTYCMWCQYTVPKIRLLIFSASSSQLAWWENVHQTLEWYCKTWTVFLPSSYYCCKNNGGLLL